MPKFVTISPTHIAGRKEDAWHNFRNGGYIAVGWMHVDLAEKSIDKIAEIVRAGNWENKSSAIDAFQKFFSLAHGDYVAVNNANHGLFGVGVVGERCYHFEKYGHDTGADEPEEFYSHLIDVDWKWTSYVRRRDILGPQETGWQPYGTMGTLLNEVPLYIRRLLGEDARPPTSTIEYVRPDWLAPVIESVEALRKDSQHQERGHESLVEDFFDALGYRKQEDIRYRQGYVDITVYVTGKPAICIEVKKDWSLSSYSDKGAISQAYRYALEKGVRYVVITNGDFYALFDRLKGLSYESNTIGEFRLTALEEEDLDTINRLKRDRLERPNLEELFRHLSEAFPQQRHPS